jgi:type IV secretory pathway VirB2 component (pilin)
MTHSNTTSQFSIDPVWVERFLAFLPLFIGLVTITIACMGNASATSLPWETPLATVACSLKGPIAKGVAVIAIVISGLMLAVGEIGGVLKTLLGLLAGVSMALLATSWLGVIDSTSSYSC